MALGYVAWIVNSMWSKTATSSPLSVDKHSFVEYFKSFPKGREVLALKVTILWSQFEVLPTSKSKNEAFPPHHLLTMCAAIRASNLLEATSTPTLNWGKGGGGGGPGGLYIVLFSEIYPFEDCVPTILLPIF